jgi:hypothetical protein
MMNFDRFLAEADARNLQAGKVAQAGGKLARDVGGLAGAAGSLAGGNFFSGIWGVLKSTLSAYEGITDTANALGRLNQIQSIHSRLYSHIASQHGESVAQQYVEAVFEADDDIIPLIPPASWDSILTQFVTSLSGNIEDYQNLTFTHAIATVLEHNMERVKGVIASKQSKWDRKLQVLDRQYHAIADFFDNTSGKTSSSRKSKPFADVFGDGPEDEPRGESPQIDTFGDSSNLTKKKPRLSKWGGYLDMEELKRDTLAKLKQTDLPFGWDDSADADREIVDLVKTKFKELTNWVAGNFIDRRLTPKNIIAAAKKMIAEKERLERLRPKRTDDIF